MTQFDGVHESLALGLADKGYDTLTPVQQAMLDPALERSDVLVSAQTGSGKTVAFGLAMAPGLLEGRAKFGPADLPMALVIAPTRELALQVRREFEWLYAATGAVLASCVGGMDMRDERRALDRGAHIVVGTPGRLRDHIERGSLDISALRVAVLDEADEMLDLGFREDLEFILKAAPQDRRTLLFSATVPREIAQLARTFQRDAVRITTAAEREQHVDIEYRALTVNMGDRENAIVNVLRYYEAKNALVFCATRATVNHLTARLGNRGFSVVALSGELSQSERTHALQAMRDGRARVCVATDVAARGIDLPNLELVIHADLPNNRDTLLHRSGRTGRAGRKGVSALVVPANLRSKAQRLLGAAGITAEWAAAPSAEDVTHRDTERLFADPALSATVTPAEAALADRLLEQFPARTVAAAFVRQYLGARSAPEDLRPVTTDGAKAKPRNEFSQSVWISLSVGSAQRAEPRWLLPMLCRAGDVTRDEIGAIRVQENETHVQLDAASSERFLAALGVSQSLEDGIRVTLRDTVTGAQPKAPAPAPPSASAPAPAPSPAPAPAAAPSPAPAPRKEPSATRTRAPDAPSPGSARERPSAPPSGAPKYQRPALTERTPGQPRPDRPRSETPRSEKPRSEAPRTQAPRTERPRADKPPVRKPDVGKPRAGKPGADRPRAERPYADKPRAGKPFAGKAPAGRSGREEQATDFRRDAASPGISLRRQKPGGAASKPAGARQGGGKPAAGGKARPSRIPPDRGNRPPGSPSGKPGRPPKGRV